MDSYSYNRIIYHCGILLKILSPFSDKRLLIYGNNLILRQYSLSLINNSAITAAYSWNIAYNLQQSN